MASSLSKLRRITLLADYEGRFQILDLSRAAAGVDRTFDLATHLSGQVSAVALDPAAGLPGALLRLDRGVAVVATVDDPTADSPSLRADWSVAKALRIGAAAVMMRVVWSADEAQQAAVTELLAPLGDECAKQELPLLVTVELKESSDPLAAARERAERVVGAAAALSAEELQVDLLALPLPGDLRHVREYAAGAIDGTEREAAGTRAELHKAVGHMDEACRRPWLLATEGPARAALLAIEMAADAGAAGFVAGDWLWRDMLAPWEPEGVEDVVLVGILPRVRRAIAAAETGRPWFAHPAVYGKPLPEPGDDWYRSY